MSYGFLRILLDFLKKVDCRIKLDIRMFIILLIGIIGTTILFWGATIILKRDYEYYQNEWWEEYPLLRVWQCLLIIMLSFALCIPNIILIFVIIACEIITLFVMKTYVTYDFQEAMIDAFLFLFNTAKNTLIAIFAFYLLNEYLLFVIIVVFIIEAVKILFDLLSPF